MRQNPLAIPLHNHAIILFMNSLSDWNHIRLLPCVKNRNECRKNPDFDSHVCVRMAEMGISTKRFKARAETNRHFSDTTPTRSLKLSFGASFPEKRLFPKTNLRSHPFHFPSPLRGEDEELALSPPLATNVWGDVGVFS
jgi:hypothetical protein